MDVAVPARGEHGQLAVIRRDAQPRAQPLDQPRARFLVADVPRPLASAACALAEIVHQRREADARLRRSAGPRPAARVPCAARCRSPGATFRAAARRTAHRAPGRCARARRRRAAPEATQRAQASPSARSVSCQTRSGTSASISPAATIARMSASVSGAIVKPSGSKRASEARDAQDPHRVLVEGVGHVPQLRAPRGRARRRTGRSARRRRRAPSR